MIKAFIDGEAGTTGLQIYGRLEKRDDVSIVSLSERFRKDPAARKEAMNASDVVFLCLPDDAAREAVGFVENPETVVIDASTAHRTAEGWAYGFPELSEEHRAKIRSSKRIANPGCYASGFLSIVYPLVKGGWVSPDYPFVCHAVSGYSGAGKKGIAAYEAEGRDPLLLAPRLYGLTLSHKHLPEMTKVAGLSHPPIFDPYICDYYAGMAVSVPVFARLITKKGTINDVFAYFAEYYARHRFVSVTQNSEDGYLSAAKLVGTNRLEIFVGGNGEQIQLTARLDNLGKGASGAAVQNMNLALGLDEGLGLESV